MIRNNLMKSVNILGTKTNFMQVTNLTQLEHNELSLVSLLDRMARGLRRSCFIFVISGVVKNSRKWFNISNIFRQKGKYYLHEIKCRVITAFSSMSQKFWPLNFYLLISIPCCINLRGEERTVKYAISLVFFGLTFSLLPKPFSSLLLSSLWTGSHS